jgi:hypothetical protein
MPERDVYTDNRGRMTEDRGQKSEGKRRTTDDGRRMTEGRRQTTVKVATVSRIEDREKILLVF